MSLFAMNEAALRNYLSGNFTGRKGIDLASHFGGVKAASGVVRVPSRNRAASNDPLLEKHTRNPPPIVKPAPADQLADSIAALTAEFAKLKKAIDAIPSPAPASPVKAKPAQAKPAQVAFYDAAQAWAMNVGNVQARFTRGVAIGSHGARGTAFEAFQLCFNSEYARAHDDRGHKLAGEAAAKYAIAKLLK